MPCSTLACPPGYSLRWNAADLLCAEGDCTVANDTEMCCTRGRFFSHSWRILADSNVSGDWEVVRVRFLLADNCDNTSEADTIPGFHSSYSGLPNGGAISHHGGRGSVAQRAFAADPKPTPREPSPVRPTWTSGGPCEPGVCFIGFLWETNVDRFPVGTCRSGCAVTSLVRKAGGVRVGCAEVEQSTVPGRFAESLKLQFLEQHVAVPDAGGGSTNTTGLWRTAAWLQGAGGGLARLQIDASAP